MNRTDEEQVEPEAEWRGERLLTSVYSMINFVGPSLG